MQEELKRCNYLGDIYSIYGLAKIATSDDPSSFNDIASICSLDSSLNVKIKPCLSFFVEIGLLLYEEERYCGTDLGIKIVEKSVEDFSFEISKHTIAYLIDNSYISSDSITYNYEQSICCIKRSGFSFSAAVMRNLLLDTGALIENESNIYEVNKQYELLFEQQIKQRKAKLSLEQLMKIHERQEQQGRLAEEFVLEFEKRRLLWCENSKCVKQISDFDVNAGYDIISFNTESSKDFDRFIEVKSFSSKQSFFWSSNEMKTAKRLKDNYFLYLVDIEQYQLNGYEPTIVCNPYDTILDSDEWVIDTASVKITKI